jgi:hypothetical protein
MDADDWIHRDVVEHVMAHRSDRCFYVDKGYLLDFSRRLVTRKRGLLRYCGSTFIFDFSDLLALAGLDGALPIDAPLEAVKNSVGNNTLVYLLGHHRYFLGALARAGIKARALPFASVCWVVNTGENRSGTAGSGAGVPLRKNLLADFGLADSVKLPEAGRGASVSSIIVERKDAALSAVGWWVTNKRREKV